MEKLIIEIRRIPKRKKQRGRNRRHVCLTALQLERAWQSHQENVARKNGRTTFISLKYRFFMVDEFQFISMDWSAATPEDRKILESCGQVEVELRQYDTALLCLSTLGRHEAYKDLMPAVDQIIDRGRDTLQVRGNARLEHLRVERSRLAPLREEIYRKLRSASNLLALSEQLYLAHRIPTTQVALENLGAR